MPTGDQVSQFILKLTIWWSFNRLIQLAFNQQCDLSLRLVTWKHFFCLSQSTPPKLIAKKKNIINITIGIQGSWVGHWQSKLILRILFHLICYIFLEDIASVLSVYSILLNSYKYQYNMAIYILIAIIRHQVQLPLNMPAMAFFLPP